MSNWVINLKTDPRADQAVNCMRPTKWGNPYMIGRDGDRAAVIRQHRAWLLRQPALLAEARQELRGRLLGCCCAPLPCHCDILADIANSPAVLFAFGSRDVTDGALVADTLAQMIGNRTEVWSGAAVGADRLAAAWAKSRGLRVREYPADWANLGQRAGIVRNEELVAALPPDALCVAFTPERYPGPEAVRAAGGVRHLLSAGTRHACGCCLARGLDTWLVWADGSRTRLTPRSRPMQDHLPNWRERHDVADTAADDQGERGWDMPTAHFLAAPTAPSERKLGEIIDGPHGRYRVTGFRGHTAILRPLPADDPDDLGADLNDLMRRHEVRGHGDGERRTMATGPGETRRTFTPSGALHTCPMCGEIVHGRPATDVLCDACTSAVAA